jgi:hypothetical protein
LDLPVVNNPDPFTAFHEFDICKTDAMVADRRKDM